MQAIRFKVALLSVALCIVAISFTFTTYYGQIFEPSPLLNTNMKFWTIDPTKNITKPYLWEVDIIKSTTDNVSIYQTEYASRPSLAIRILRAPNSSMTWATAHVRQDLRGIGLSEIFRSKISLLVFPTFPYYYNVETKNPESAFGIEINDGTNLLWYIFADEPTQTFQLPHHRIVLTQAPLNAWSQKEIDIADQYAQAGWQTPQSLSFTLIMGMTSSHPGNWVGYFSGLTINLEPLQTESLSLTQRLGVLAADAFLILGLVTITVLMQRRTHHKFPSPNQSAKKWLDLFERKRRK